MAARFRRSCGDFDDCFGLLDDVDDGCASGLLQQESRGVGGGDGGDGLGYKKIFAVGGLAILVVGGVSKLISMIGSSKDDPGNGISLQADSDFRNGHCFSLHADLSGEGSGLRDDPDGKGLQEDSGDVPGLGFGLQDDDYPGDGNGRTLGHVFNFLDDDSRTDGTSLQDDPGHDYSDEEQDYSGGETCLRDHSGHDFDLQDDSGDGTALQDDPGQGFSLRDYISGDGASLEDYPGHGFSLQDDDSSDGTGLGDDPGHGFVLHDSGSGTVLGDYPGEGTDLEDYTGHGFSLQDDDSTDGTGLEDDPGHGFVLHYDSGYGRTVLGDNPGDGTGLEDYLGHGFVLQDDSGDGTVLGYDPGDGFSLHVAQDDYECYSSEGFSLQDDANEDYGLPEYFIHETGGSDAYFRRTSTVTEDQSFGADSKSTVEMKAEESPTSVFFTTKRAKHIKHYSSTQKILLVGEGNFSFSACLAKAFGSATNMVATSLDSYDFIHRNYGFDGWLNLINLKEKGCRLIHDVDSTAMAFHAEVGSMTFDVIVYNFPHAGFKKFESRASQLRRHRSLVMGFFENAKRMLSNGGEIHVSHKTNGFFAEWRIEEMAAQCGLHMIERTAFQLSDYPGYETKYGFGGNKNFDCYPSMTYKFAPSSIIPNSLGRVTGPGLHSTPSIPMGWCWDQLPMSII